MYCTWLIIIDLSAYRLFETLQSLFWSIFGLINLYVTNVKADHKFTEFVGATMFGTYNIISLVVLLNMLIAMMNNSYQHIAVSAIAGPVSDTGFIALTYYLLPLNELSSYWMSILQHDLPQSLFTIGSC